MFLKELVPSKIADHKYHLESEVEQQLSRQICTPGTRVRILDDIVTWAKNTSADNPSLYWLFGPAGSGKSTIAYTIARRFEFVGDATDTTILGGNFFCSRLFDETRLSRYILRTIVYHLALKCEAFAEKSTDFDTVNQDVAAQFEELLLKPWQASESARYQDTSSPPPQYLIVIDALDEIGGIGGFNFLHVLLDVIDKNERRLRGLRFFVTSRQDQGLVNLVESFEQKRLYRLQDVAKEEVHADIKTYLNASGLHLNDSSLEQLAYLAAGLFIYATTVVKYLIKRGKSEQKMFLAKLLATSKYSNLQPPSIATPFAQLDRLYAQILDDVFHGFNPGEQDWMDPISILHTFLCTAGQISASIVAELLFPTEMDDVADSLLSSLHAVLYTEGSKVLWYHKSFPDFIFTKDRSKGFWCDQVAHHQHLAEMCFRVMDKGLRFNVANIESSFILDKENTTLPDNIKRHILPVLSYSCRNWDHHLCAATSMQSDILLVALSQFVQLRILFWIEAMNLLKLPGRCDQMLQKACEWVIRSQGSSLLADYLTEASLFAQYFSRSGASASTPHLYISALATWPGNSEPCLGWKSHFPRIPAFINASLDGNTLKMNGPVAAVACSQDGRYIITGSDDSSVRIWDALTGNELKVLWGHMDWVRSVAVSQDGKSIVSGSGDSSIRVWDASTGKELKEIMGHTDGVRSVAFSQDGKRIVSGSYDGSVRIWDALTGQELNELKGHTGLVTSVAFSQQDEHVISGSFDSSVRVWDATTGNALKELKGHRGWVTSVVSSQDGKHIVTGSADSSVRVWDALTGKELRELTGHAAGVTSVALSQDGKHIASGSYDCSVRLWNASTGEQSHELTGHADGVRSVAFLQDGNRIVSGSNDGLVLVWDLAQEPRYIREIIPGPEYRDRLTGWLLSPDDNRSRLMLVPVAHLPDSSHILTLPYSASSYVDFAHTPFGTRWMDSYRP